MFIPDKTYCDALVEECSDVIKKDFNIDGYDISCYYHNNIDYNSMHYYQAYELDGLTFVKSSGFVWDRYLMTQKLYYLNENDLVNANDLSDGQIVNVTEIVEGETFIFIQLPNGRIIPKTKMSFDDDVCREVKRISKENRDLRVLVSGCMKNNLQPIFKYHNNNITLIAVRTTTGEYADLKNIDFNIMKSRFYEIDDDKSKVEYWFDYSKEKENIIGWILYFNDKMVKLNTKWYKIKQKKSS